MSHNGLHTGDASVLAFLMSKDPDWAETQLVPPRRLEAAVASSVSVVLTWPPIDYTQDGGYYEVEFATAADGPFQPDGQTRNKQSGGYTVHGLSPDTTYYFRLRTFTPALDVEQGERRSGYSAVVSATTPALFAGDVYEVNDTCAQAHAILADGTSIDPLNATGTNLRSFHIPGDVDWVRFEARANVRYRVDTLIPPGSKAGCGHRNLPQL